MIKYINNNEGIKFFLENKLVATIAKDNFNSEIFGMTMGNLMIHCDELNISEVENIAKLNNFSHLAIRLSTDQKKLLHRLETSGFNLMDTLVTYKYDYSRKKLENFSHNCELRDCYESDIPILKEFAEKAFKIDRYHSDPSLDNLSADEYYARWIENSYNGFADKVIVAVVEKEPVGFTTCNLPKNSSSNTGKMILSAVSEKSRGRKVYTSMIHEGLKWFEGKVEIVEVGTQINNYAVQKTWMNLGLFLFKSHYVLHKRIDKIEK